MKLTTTIFLFLVSCFLFSCGNDVAENETENINVDSLNTNAIVTDGEIKIIEPVVDEEIVILKNGGITLTEIKVDNSPAATIKLNTKQFNEGENQLSFSASGVTDYTISYLANNYSLNQFSSDIIEVDFLFGNNVFLAFLTDNKYISIKTNKGCVLKNAVLGDETQSLFDMDQPHLFYYLPQTETNPTVLDFYLVNTSISEDGNKVKVTINDAEFILNKWAAYQISGLKSNKEHTVRIQLLDKKGNLIDGPFNDSGDRKFLLQLNS